jgi:MYXO-CTERM domain-containing protein
MRAMRFLPFAIVLSSLAVAAPAAAAVNAVPCGPTQPRCQRAPFEVSKIKKAPVDFDWDSGWIPPNSAVQIRLVASVHYRTKVDMKGDLDATWPEVMTMTPSGRKAAGEISLDNGVVAKAQGRFSVTIGGQTYAWTGDLPGIPKVDLTAIAAQGFDPWAWKGEQSTAKVSATTPQVTLAKVPLTDSIIPIPGIEGGFQLEGTAEFSASYATTKIVFEDGALADANRQQPWTRLLLSSTPAFDTKAQIHGELQRGLRMHFIPGFYFEILGRKFELELVDIPVSLPESAPEEWVFDPIDFHVPLPRVEVQPLLIDLGDVPAGAAAPAEITVSDTGEERAIVEVRGDAAIDKPRFELAAANKTKVALGVTPAKEGPFEATVVVASNDPLAPETVVRIRGKAGPRAGAGDAPGADGGCGCRAARADSTAAWALVFVAALAALARRRHRARG